VHPQPKKEHLDFTSITTGPQQAGDATQLYMGNINQIKNHFLQFLLYSIILASRLPSQERRDTGRLAHP
jgi:hypothetical protein